jgi:nucleoside-diphosphate-sugar epimerase
MENKETKKQVLVTGGSGFIAVHTMAKLLQKGYKVRATLRTLSRQEEVKSMLAQAGISNFDDLEFIQADLTHAENWTEAAAGATYVIHVASPTPATRPDADEAMVKMAIDGVLNVFRAAKAAGVKRIVLTSASGAVLAGHNNHTEIFTENDWTNLDAPINAYQRSKTRAEQEAWKFAKENDMELASILPVAVMGPVLGNDFSHSNQTVKDMLEGKMPNLLRLGFDYVDVRDVADLHILAMEREEAAGERFLATAGENLTFKQIAEILKKHFGDKANKVSTKEIADFVVKILSLFIKKMRMPASFLGQNTACSNEKAKKMLGWQPRSAEDAVVATAESMFRLGLIKN